MAKILSIIFGILTICGAIYVIASGGRVNAGYAVVPMIFGLIFGAIARNQRKMKKQLTIKVFEETLGVCRLEKSAQVPDWAEGNFLTITRTPDELSIVCCQKNIPENVKCERDWRYFKIDEVLDFSLVGILASLSGTLACQGISIFAISTYDTDYILVKEEELDRAIQVLKSEGYRVLTNGQGQ